MSKEPARSLPEGLRDIPRREDLLLSFRLVVGAHPSVGKWEKLLFLVILVGAHSSADGRCEKLLFLGILLVVLGGALFCS